MTYAAVIVAALIVGALLSVYAIVSAVRDPEYRAARGRRQR